MSAVTQRVHGREAMNELSRFEVEFACDDPALDLDKLVGVPAELQLYDAEVQDGRAIALVVVSGSFQKKLHATHDAAPRYLYRLELGAPVALLARRHGNRVFLDKGTEAIVRQVLGDAGVKDALVWRLGGSYDVRVQCIQHGETEWAFVERLLADEGIAYWFDHDGSAGQIVFGDGPGAHEGLRGGATLPFHDASAMIAGRHLSELWLTERVATTATHLSEYDPRRPDVLIEGKAGSGPFEYFEHPAHVLTDAAAKRRAAVRLEQLQRHRTVAEGRSNSMRVQPGRALDVEGASDDWFQRRYLVVSVEHEGHGGGYTNRVRLVPLEPAGYRPPPPAEQPRVEGLTTAVTTGPAGEEIHVDDLGAVKLRFLWDRSGISDDRSSAWARTLQANTGGSMLLPRVGWEVPIAFVHGDPDRPFVLGRVYNGTAVLPYGLPGKNASTALQSNTTPGNGTTNEIRMSDTAGSQEFFIHASRDQNVTVGGSAETTVGANETHDVALALSHGIAGSQSASIGANQNLNVTGDVSLGVGGGRSESVGAMETQKIDGSRVMQASGSYFELVGGIYGVQCNQSNYTVKGAFTQLIGGVHANAAGLGWQESVAAARTVLVGAASSITAGASIGEKVTGVKNLTAGPTTEKAGAKIMTDVTAAGSVKAASAKMSAGGNFTLEAPNITITVSGSVKAQALKLSGGFKVTSGGTTLKGTIKRTGGSKIE